MENYTLVIYNRMTSWKWLILSRITKMFGLIFIIWSILLFVWFLSLYKEKVWKNYGWNIDIMVWSTLWSRHRTKTNKVKNTANWNDKQHTSYMPSPPSPHVAENVNGILSSARSIVAFKLSIIFSNLQRTNKINHFHEVILLYITSE
jgi:hypothetical protein